MTFFPLKMSIGAARLQRWVYLIGNVNNRSFGETNCCVAIVCPRLGNWVCKGTSVTGERSFTWIKRMRQLINCVEAREVFPHVRGQLDPPGILHASPAVNAAPSSPLANRGQKELCWFMFCHSTACSSHKAATRLLTDEVNPTTVMESCLIWMLYH